MAGRKPGALVKISELTGLSKSLVRHCATSLQGHGAISVPDLGDRETWKPQLMDTAAIISVARLTRSGFATVHAAAMVAAMFDASAHLSTVYPDLKPRPFWNRFNEGLLQWFGPGAAELYGRGDDDIFREITFREFLWSALVTSDVFDRFGFCEPSQEAIDDARRATEVWNRHNIGGQKVVAAPPMPACLVRYSERLANSPTGWRCTVHVERPGQNDWVLFGSGAGGNKIEQTIRNAVPFETMTAFQPRVLLTEAYDVHQSVDPSEA